MRKISANYIYPVASPPIRNGIVILSEKNEIIEILDKKDEFNEISNLEFYNGVIVPGFINTHCHLELSYLKNQIPCKQGLLHFINQIRTFRNNNSEMVKVAIDADLQMQTEGIVAVGDISNVSETFLIKKESKIFYYTFIELFSPEPNAANDKIESGNKLIETLGKYGLSGSLTPHSFYSTSEKLMDRIQTYSDVYSVHFLESKYEQQFLEQHSGPFLDFYTSINMPVSGIIKTGNNFKNAIASKFPVQKNVLLVHNTFVKQELLKYISDVLKTGLYWVICPNSNLYIENSLPDISAFVANSQLVTLGTDSLASNSKLSILEEMKTINTHFPEIPFEELIHWATLNGAKALHIEKRYGSLEVGKAPGINLIENFDFEKKCLTNKSRVRVLAS